MSEDSSIQDLNVIRSDLRDESDLSPTTSEQIAHRELEAQLQMWTNLQFNASPEEQYFSPERDTASKSRHKALNPHLSDLQFFGNVGAALSQSQQDSTASASYERAKQQQAAMAAAHAHSINDLLAWGIYPPNAADSLFPPAQVASGVENPILDPLLHSFVAPTRPGATAGSGLPPLTLRDVGRKAKQASSVSSAQLPMTIDPATTTIAPPPSKRAKVRRPPGGYGIAGDHNLGDYHLVSHEEEEDMTFMDHPAEDATHENAHQASTGGASLSPAEDKRRRNTLASARFRLKKKEREVAMEKRAKELDDRVADLERECESLRKENHWLKSLVVGATMGEDSVPQSTLTSPANGVVESAGSAIGAALGGQGNVIDIDELVRVLKSKGAVITSSSSSQPVPTASAQSTVGPTPTTGKRKRGAAAPAAST